MTEDERYDLITAYGVCPNCGEPKSPTLVSGDDGAMTLQHVCGTESLTDFLLARLADLELAAQIALATAPSEPIEGITPAGAVWFTPEQVLADVAAKRQIVAALVAAEGRAAAEWSDYSDWIAGSAPVERPVHAGPSRDVIAGLQRATRALASVYADHPDYQPEWRP